MDKKVSGPSISLPAETLHVADISNNNNNNNNSSTATVESHGRSWGFGLGGISSLASSVVKGAYNAMINPMGTQERTIKHPNDEESHEIIEEAPSPVVAKQQPAAQPSAATTAGKATNLLSSVFAVVTNPMGSDEEDKKTQKQASPEVQKKVIVIKKEKKVKLTSANQAESSSSTATAAQSSGSSSSTTLINNEPAPVSSSSDASGPVATADTSSVQAKDSEPSSSPSVDSSVSADSSDTSLLLPSNSEPSSASSADSSVPAASSDASLVQASDSNASSSSSADSDVPEVTADASSGQVSGSAASSAQATNANIIPDADPSLESVKSILDHAQSSLDADQNIDGLASSQLGKLAINSKIDTNTIEDIQYIASKTFASFEDPAADKKPQLNKKISEIKPQASDDESLVLVPKKPLTNEYYTHLKLKIAKLKEELEKERVKTASLQVLLANSSSPLSLSSTPPPPPPMGLLPVSKEKTWNTGEGKKKKKLVISGPPQAAVSLTDIASVMLRKKTDPKPVEKNDNAAQAKPVLVRRPSQIKADQALALQLSKSAEEDTAAPTTKIDSSDSSGSSSGSHDETLGNGTTSVVNSSILTDSSPSNDKPASSLFKPKRTLPAIPSDPTVSSTSGDKPSGLGRRSIDATKSAPAVNVNVSRSDAQFYLLDPSDSSSAPAGERGRGRGRGAGRGSKAAERGRGGIQKGQWQRKQSSEHGSPAKSPKASPGSPLKKTWFTNQE